jgi:hypothetical protein
MAEVIVLSVLGAGIVVFLVLRQSPEEPVARPIIQHSDVVMRPMYTIDDDDTQTESNATTIWERAATTAM